MLYKKRFGQHFLIDHSLPSRIVHAARIASEDTVLEIGPGRGALTSALAAAAHRVVAIEIDRDLISELRAQLPENVELLGGDALKLEFPAGPFHVVANLPYNVATPLLKRFVEQRHAILSVTVMLQSEVARRIVALPGTPGYGPLSILLQYYADCTLEFDVSPSAFRPRPKVQSSVVRLVWKPGVESNEGFTDFVLRAFSTRRKKLVTTLGTLRSDLDRSVIRAMVEAVGVHPDARPEMLSVAQFLDVYNRLSAVEAQCRPIKHSK